MLSFSFSLHCFIIYVYQIANSAGQFLMSGLLHIMQIKVCTFTNYTWMQQKKMKVVIGIYYLSLINPHFQTDLSMKKNL